MYKKALALDTEQKNESAAYAFGMDDDDAREYGVVAPGTAFESNATKHTNNKKLATKPPDLELYERHTQYHFLGGDGRFECLPAKDTPEVQVVPASHYEFFRLVHYHGGKHPRLTYYEPSDMPIITMSPVVKLSEGGGGTFGVRQALVQYYAWGDKYEFIDIEEIAVQV